MPKKKRPPAYMTVPGKDGALRSLPLNRAARQRIKKLTGLMLPPLLAPIRKDKKDAT